MLLTDSVEKFLARNGAVPRFMTTKPPAMLAMWAASSGNARRRARGCTRPELCRRRR